MAELTKEELITLSTYEAIAETWDSEHARPRWKDEGWSIFTENFSVGSKILDLGCGTAMQEARFVFSEGFRYFGIDISPRMVSVARKNLSGKPGITDQSVQRMDMRKLDFAEETFHGFISATSFMHLPRETLPHALAEAHRVTKKGGRGLISISRGTFEGLYVPDGRDLPAYVVCWEDDKFSEALKNAGFTICYAAEAEYMLVYVVEK